MGYNLCWLSSQFQQVCWLSCIVITRLPNWVTHLCCCLTLLRYIMVLILRSWSVWQVSVSQNRPILERILIQNSILQLWNRSDITVCCLQQCWEWTTIRCQQFATSVTSLHVTFSWTTTQSLSWPTANSSTELCSTTWRYAIQHPIAL